MGENKDKVVDVIKKSYKSWAKKLIIIVLIIVIIIIFLGASAYEIDGKNWKNTTTVAAGYTSNVTINSNGSISGSTTSQELWDKMIEKDTDVEKYLDTPEELLKLMNAEIITQFPDTRPREELTKPIDWESINANTEESVMQGIIKFKRKDPKDNESILAYAEPSTFDGWLESYNTTDDNTEREDAKKNLLSHFTIRQDIKSPTGGTGFVVTGKMADVTQAILSELAKDPIEEKYGLGESNCQKYVRLVYERAGVVPHSAFQGACCAYKAGQMWGVSTNFDEIINGATVWTGKGYYGGGTCKNHPNSIGGAGHTGIYYEENDVGYVKHWIGTSVKIDTLDDWIQKYSTRWGNTAVWGWSGGLTVVEEGEVRTTETEDSETDTEEPDIKIQTENNNGYYVEVATWEETTDKVENKNTKDENAEPDPDVEQYTDVTYTMSTTPVNYQDLVKGFTMPFEYLWAMLVISEDKDFVMDLADLVYNSEIEITVHDNLTTTTKVNEYTYTKLRKAITDAKVTATGTKIIGDTIKSEAITDTCHETDIDDPNYKTTHTTITKTNTLDIAVTYADVWMAKYTQDYTNQVPEAVVSNSENTLEDIPYPDEANPSDETDEDICDRAADLLESAKNSLENSGCIGVNGYINDVNVKIYYSTVDRKENVTNTMSRNKYTASPMKVEEKVDKDSDEPNFVTIFLDKDNSQAKNYILDVDDWLYELLEQNESTVELVDLTKYLIYKATDRDYGEIDWDFSVYAISSFSSVSYLYGDSIQEKVWFALIDLGYSEIAAAGAMGNIHYESEIFDSTKVEGGYNDSNGGIGICQWTNNNRGTEGRNTQLKLYAASKGVEWTDEDTQVEFLIAELTGTGDASEYASKQLLDRREYYGNELAFPDGWKNATTVDDATIAFCCSFERPGISYATSSMSTRQHWANYYYAQFKGRTRGGAYNSEAGAGAVKGHYTNSEGKTFTILNQTKISGWGSKCNRAASAIIASGYSDEDADELINYMNSQYKGDIFGAIPSDKTYWSKYGLTVSSSSDTKSYSYMTSLKQQLISGGYALYWLNNEGSTYYGKSGTQWTSKYHWVAIIDYKSENGTDKICVADYRGITWVDIDEFKDNGVRRMVYVNEE